MADCVQSAQDFILDAFPVMVGSLVSEDAEVLCQKNDLSFVELVRPFCQLDSEAQIHDPINPTLVIPVKNWKLRVVDIQSVLPPPVLVARILNEVVNKCVPAVDLQHDVHSQLNASTPWFEAYRDCFFQLLQPMTHEFMRDFLACILVVSSKHPDPMHAFAALSSRQNTIQNATENHKNTFHWFTNNTFKYYLLLHDVSDGDDSKAEKIFLSMKSVYGSHTCFLLQINSRKKMYPQASHDNMTFSDPWSSHIYPLGDDTLEFDEEEVESDNRRRAATSMLASQSDVDQQEQAIVKELESIEKEIAEHPEAPSRSLSFNDPLTSMHYETLDQGTEITSQKNTHTETETQPKQTTERSRKFDEYKKSLRQFSYHRVSSLIQFSSSTQSLHPPRKEKGQCMALVDQDKIKNFIYEFAVRGLLPHVEKLMRNLSEQILNRRGLHKSIFHATKKWFGSNKTQNVASVAAGGGLSAGSSYPTDSAELQHRKLGDLSFLVQHYELAYNSYHSAKREFNNDHAWLYFAGSLEMAAISAFLQTNNKNYPVHYFEACISTYLNTCRLPRFATRACLLSSETLKSKNRFQEAAQEFIKLTNEEFDLRSALLLEQAAHCYLRQERQLLRKYAFHMILAGHRYSKSSQRKHTLRCYINALRVYGNKGWYMAEDHVNFVVGRQSFNLGTLKDAYLALHSLLVHESDQSPSQQTSYLREFLSVFKKILESQRDTFHFFSSSPLPLLPIPNIDMQSTRCLTHFKSQVLSPTPSTTTSWVSKRTRNVHAGSYTFQKNFSKVYAQQWEEMEKEIVQHVTGDLPYPFKAYTPCLSSKTLNISPAIVAVGEQFAYEVVFSNPLKISLNLLGLTLLFEFACETTGDEQKESEPVMNKVESLSHLIDCEVIENLFMKPSEKKPVCIKLTAKTSGSLSIVGVKYELSSASVISPPPEPGAQQEIALLKTVSVPGMQEILVKGVRLNKTKQQKSLVTHDVDKRLEINICPRLPLLEVTMNELPLTLLCGEVRRSTFTFKNIGSVSFKNVYVLCSFPQAFSFEGTSVKWEYANDSNQSPVIKLGKDTAPCDIIKIPLTNDLLGPDEMLTVPVSVYGLPTAGVHEIYFLFYYEPSEDIHNVPYRLVQQMIRVQTLSTMSITTSTQPSLCKRITEKDCANLQEYIFSLAVENRAQGSLNLRCVEFTLKRMSCYSSRFKVQGLVTLPQETYLLRPGETCALHAKTNPLKDNTNDGDVFISNILLDDNGESNVERFSTDLFLQSKRHVDAINESFALILYWETSFIDETFTRNVIYGQSHVTFPFSLRPIVGKNEKESGNELMTMVRSPTQGLNISYGYDTIIEHDFSKSKSSVCIVPITVECSNSTDDHVTIEIETMDVNEIGEENGAFNDQQKEQASPINHFVWCGHRKRKLAVPSQSSSSVQLDLLTTIGLHEIQNITAWIIKTLDNGTTERTQLSVPNSHFVCVKDVLS